MWSEPHRISERLLNSYKLETLEGQPLDGEYHARRLRVFKPREGTELAAQQKEVEERRIETLNNSEEPDMDIEPMEVQEQSTRDSGEELD
jgi:hypothetical protein